MRSLETGDDIVCNISYGVDQRLLERVMRFLGMSHAAFRTHSLRRGGATALSMSGLTLAEVMVAGRWASERSAKLYVQKGEVLLLRLRNAAAPASQRRIQMLARVGPFLFDSQWLKALLPELPAG